MRMIKLVQLNLSKNKYSFYFIKIKRSNLF
jgi:hypothetical protein